MDIDQEGLTIYKDHEEVSVNYILRNQDKLTTDYNEVETKKKIEPIKTQVRKETKEKDKMINLSINGEQKNINYNKENFQFVDVFDYIDFNLNEAKGTLVLKVNGLDAEYLQNLKNGDSLEILWES